MRYAAMCAVAFFGPAAPAVQAKAASGLFAFYLLTFALSFKSYLAEAMCVFGGGIFDKGFTPSGRRRLTKLDANKVPDMLVSGTCLFWGLPVIYMLVPGGSMYYLGHIGSRVAVKAMVLSLTVGWSYRMSERFCVDGHVGMSWVNGALTNKKQPPSYARACLLRLAGAVMSPTAVLHWLTAVTLFTGFVSVRSLDGEVAAALLR